MAGEKEFLLTWSIENYFFCSHSFGNSLRSPNFRAENLDFSEWSFYLFPNGCDLKPMGYASLKLINLNRSSVKSIDLNVKLCNANGEVILELYETKYTDIRGEKNYVFPNMFRAEELEEKMKMFSKDTLVIQCRMSKDKNPEDKYTTIKSCSLQTVVGVDKFSFCLHPSYSESKDMLMKETLPYMKQAQFETTLRTNEDDVLIEISTIRKYEPSKKVKCQVYLLNQERKVILSHCDIFSFDSRFKEKKIWHFPSFLKKSSFSPDSNGCCPTIQFIFFISNDLHVNECSKETEFCNGNNSLNGPDFSPSIVSLQDDLRASLADDKYADVELIVDKETIRAHKMILASRSPVFSTMFDQDMTESHTGTIQISDMNVKTVKQFLKFLYTATLDRPDLETALELLLAAEKYQVHSLKERCSRVLMTSHLTLDSVCEVVSIADMVGDGTLKSAAISFIEKNVVKVLSSPNWPKWIRKNGELGSEILCKVSEKTVKDHSDV